MNFEFFSKPYTVRLRIGGLQWDWSYPLAVPAQAQFERLAEKHINRPHDLRIYRHQEVLGSEKVLPSLPDTSDPRFEATIKVYAKGIPALAGITMYNPGLPARRGIHDKTTGALIDPGDPPEPEEIEFELFDRRGFKAPWLEAKLTDDDWQDIERQLLDSRKRYIESQNF